MEQWSCIYCCTQYHSFSGIGYFLTEQNLSVNHNLPELNTRYLEFLNYEYWSLHHDQLMERSQKIHWIPPSLKVQRKVLMTQKEDFICVISWKVLGAHCQNGDFQTTIGIYGKSWVMLMIRIMTMGFQVPIYLMRELEYPVKVECKNDCSSDISFIGINLRTQTPASLDMPNTSHCSPNIWADWCFVMCAPDEVAGLHLKDELNNKYIF